MAYNYVDSFLTNLQQKYARELTSAALTTDRVMWLGAKTIKIPRMDVAGYKDHSRAGGWNRQAIANDFETKVLQHDRDVEFYVDAMDVDETNQILSAANVTNVFETEQAIPELDKYRYSKLYAEMVQFGGKPDTSKLDVTNVLLVYDDMMEKMDEAGVPESGRVLYATPTVYKLLKQAADIQRFSSVQNNNGKIDRAVRQLDDVTLIKVPSDRMKTVYDFSDGAVTGVGAKQINMILVHPSCVLAPVKHTAIYLWEPGSHTQGDGWLYQNRRYTDLFLIERKVAAVQMNVEGSAGGGE
ncbi:MAG: capsid protein [Paenibacillus dendritiformis]|uniref:capsid protein n=1 Tax=uncultured Paenibacillus sp. TaxID=227322 RepID=UPI0025E6EEE2|nr:capsid protein [uncultured Paenibacillus sp.]MDU5143524.1 capsid protein [Paenibacillus dendritiformis]